jgi:hypothetical protein
MNFIYTKNRLNFEKMAKKRCILLILRRMESIAFDLQKLCS